MDMNHTRFYAASSPEPTGKIRSYLRSNVFNVVTQKCQNLPMYLSNRTSIFLSYTEEFYLITIAIVVTRNVFLSCSKIDLKIVGM